MDEIASRLGVIADRAATVEATFRVRPSLYLIGSLERGVTVYKQQVRAHNLVWALWELERHGGHRVGRVAIVGGGIAGLTVAGCLLALFGEEVPITIFEQLWDLCPLQQGADARWLHPRIYEWPADGSRAPSASLPVLNWSEGRASDVAKTVVQEFSEYCRVFARIEQRLTVFLGLQHFQIETARMKIDWIAKKARRAGAFFHVGEAQGSTASFDTIILVVGFGLERFSPEYPTESYWRNEQFGQPVLDGSQRRYVVSGYGDGALIDLCRLTIERFRQDTIVYEMFRTNLESVEERFCAELEAGGRDMNVFELFTRVEDELLADAKRELAKRIRKDTAVVLHLSGKDSTVKSFRSIFGGNSSFLNRLMAFLLYRCGAFSISFSDLDATVRRQGAPRGHVLCRHGAETMKQLRAMIEDYESIEARLEEMKKKQEQKSLRLWVPGCFPHYSSRSESDDRSTF